MSRRLLNRARPSGKDPSSFRAPAPLPDYQSPSCRLNDHARRALGDLLDNRGTASYEDHLKASVRHLGLGVGDLHERLATQQDRLRNLRRRRLEKDADKTADEERLETHLAQLQDDVDELTRDSEQALRDVIDHQVEVQHHAAVLGDLFASASTAAPAGRPRARESRRQRVGEKQEDDPPNPPGTMDWGASQDDAHEPAPSIVAAFQDAVAKKQAEYEAQTHHQRYALHNDYIGFKKIWHDAAAGGDGTPLPDASQWFRSDGRPVMSRPGAKNRRSTMGDDDDDDDDDDVAVAREFLSLNCPLTLRQMEEPYSNMKCKHTFEKSAILDYLSGGGTSQCPQTGCHQEVSKSRFDQDFYLDEAILRRIKRAKQAQRATDDMDVEDNDGQDDVPDESLVFENERRVREREAKKERL
ncbi:uncharacterized protein UV8b_00500 [Ustilaginoidea virens]|uniref:SP-RING-type domain-containing protein n=1 Tax=Ustilaginoidea virens TaxID=1159556 RepID=A0A063BPJ3_USTVR|nr:uncharacterized protein UV8b_00500 [Ustilaginoidea virens]QUC16259.1 hypothetical protein UV8b_00500 [Ustilaginoidea virens]GAO14989.1 hypothetical protein UVI_02027830 [Ustilaginoidea virens]